MTHKEHTREPRTGGVKPGTEDVTIVDDRSQSRDPDTAVTKKERKIAKTILPFVLMALIIATIAAALLTRRWEFLLALLVFVPYLFLISAPVWLAASSKVAKNEHAREQGQGTGNTPQGPKDRPDPRGPKEP